MTKDIYFFQKVIREGFPSKHTSCARLLAHELLLYVQQIETTWLPKLGKLSANAGANLCLKVGVGLFK